MYENVGIKSVKLHTNRSAKLNKTLVSDVKSEHFFISKEFFPAALS